MAIGPDDSNGPREPGGEPGHVVSLPYEAVDANEREALERAFGRLDPVALGVALGIVTGLGLAAATAALLLKGGEMVGFHLQRLAYFLPGYAVSWPGVGIAAIDGLVLGFLLGAAIAGLWNLYHRLLVGVLVARERSREIRRELQEL